MNATLFWVHATWISFDTLRTQIDFEGRFLLGVKDMRKLMLALGATAMVVPTLVMPVSSAQARKHYSYKEWRGKDGRYRCRKPDGTTGLIVGGVAGGLLGRTIDTRGDRTVGTLGGAALGALAGREIERGTSSRRCR